MRHLIWNVDPAIFILGPIEVRWYGLFFALGFFLGFQIMAQFYRREQRDLENLSELCLYLMLGTIIGARLGTFAGNWAVAEKAHRQSAANAGI